MVHPELEANGVALLDLKRQYATLRDEIEAEVKAVCESQHFIMGPKVAAFEDEIARYCDCKHAIGVSSGSDALLIALMAFDIGQGDEVITSPFTFFATGGAIARVGARPVFCDIEADTYNLDPQSVSAFIESNCEFKDGVLVNRLTGGCIKSIMPVHLFGQTANMEALRLIAEQYSLTIVEDAAQAIGSESQSGQRAGTIGDIGCFSFFPSKNLGAFGDAGMCVTNNDELAEKLKILRLHGSKPKYYHALIGGNFRLDALQAAILGVKLRYLDQWTEKRQQHADLYRQLLANCDDSLTLPLELAEGRHIYNQFTLSTPARDELVAYLKSNKIGSEIYYPVPLHLQQCFSYLGLKEGDVPVAERAAKSVFSVPIYPELERIEIEFVATRIMEFF